jgi:hypothetical protein
VLNPACKVFREGFERGQRAPHTEECEACLAWAQQIEGWSSLGLDLPLSDPLRSALQSMGPRAESPRGEIEVQGVPALAFPLPQVPLPTGMRERLRRIPEDRDRVLPAWASRSRDLLAASCLVALGLTAVLRTPPPRTIEAAETASRRAALTVREAGSRGTKSLVGMGDSLSKGIAFLNQSAGILMGRLGTRNTHKDEPPSGPAPPEKAPARITTEDHHGKRTGPRNGNGTSHD